MKNKFMLRLCLMMALLSLNSCRQDILPEKETYHNTSAFQLTSKRISLDEAKHKASLLHELQKAEKEVEKQKLNIQGKLVNVGGGIMIDTEEVIYMENGPDFHTYTFSVVRENVPANAPVENILMTPQPDGSYRVFHIVLNLTEADKAKIGNREFVDYKNKEKVTELSNINLSSLSQKQICIPHYYSYPVPCKGPEEHLPEQAGCPLEGFDRAYWGTIVLYDCFGEVYETITPTDPGGPSGGGGRPGGGEGTNPNNPPDDCTNAATNPNQVGIVDQNGCNIGVPTEPLIPPKTDPCQKIKAKFADIKFKEKVTAIDKPTVFDYDHEMGYAAGYPPANTGVTGTQYPPMENVLGSHSVSLPSGNQYFGFMHSHTNREGAIKIFSPGDLATFLTSCVVNANNSGSIGDAYSMVITSQGNYILKYIGNTTNFGYTTTTKDAWMEWYITQLKKIQNDDNTFDQDKLEKLFLRFLKEKVKIDGIELYKVEKITGKANKLSLDSNNNVIPTPCD